MFVDGSTNDVPRRRRPLPLVDQDRLWGLRDSKRVGLKQLDCRRFIQMNERTRPACCRGGLPDALRAFDAHCGQAQQQLIEFVVDDPSDVFGSLNFAFHRLETTIRRSSTLPFVVSLRFR